MYKGDVPSITCISHMGKRRLVLAKCVSHLIKNTKKEIYQYIPHAILVPRADGCQAMFMCITMRVLREALRKVWSTC
jgi:hypothetical protein